MGMFPAGAPLALLLALVVGGMIPPCAQTAQAAARQAVVSVYDKQPPVTEKEVLGFVELLPRFRQWARDNKEEAHPVRRKGRPDFLYSPEAAAWVKNEGWDPRRFFCVMGRMAAAVTILAEGNDMPTRPGDMPAVSSGELELARVHMGSLLKAGASAGAGDVSLPPRPPIPSPARFALEDNGGGVAGAFPVATVPRICRVPVS